MLFSLLCVLLAATLVPPLAQAEIKVITAEATYSMGDGETPDFAEARVFQRAKQTALEEAGTYVQSYTKMQNLDLTTEEILTVAGGVLQVEVLKKTRAIVGDGVTFYIKIRATVTTDKMEELANRIRGKNVGEEYKKLQDQYARLSNEVDMLKRRVAEAPRGSERDVTLDQIREVEKAFSKVQKQEAAFYQRLVSGEGLFSKAEKQLGEKRARMEQRKSTLDRLFLEIEKRGQTVEIGEPDIETNIEQPQTAEIRIPVTVTATEGIQEFIDETRRTLGKDYSDEEYEQITKFIQRQLVLVMELALRDGTSYKCATTMVRGVVLDGDYIRTETRPKSVSLTINVPMKRVKEIASVSGKFVRDERIMRGSSDGNTSVKIPGCGHDRMFK